MLYKINLLLRLHTKILQRFTSLLQKIAYIHQNTLIDKIKIIQPYIIPLQEDQLPISINPDKNRAIKIAISTQGIQIATSSSRRKDIVGIKGTVYNTLSNKEATIYSVTLRPKTEQNLYTAKLAAISTVIKYLLPDLQGRHITIFSSNQAALLALS